MVWLHRCLNIVLSPNLAVYHRNTTWRPTLLYQVIYWPMSQRIIPGPSSDKVLNVCSVCMVLLSTLCHIVYNLSSSPATLYTKGILQNAVI